MEKWIFLLLSLGALFIAYEAICWYLLVRKYPIREIENTVGYDYRNQPNHVRTQMANHHRGLGGTPFKVVAIVLIMVAIFIGATVRAFLL